MRSRDVMRPMLSKSSPERSFESLYRRHAGDIYRYSRALLERPADAEDATQTTFMNAYRALARGDHPSDSGKWLRAIALNVCREHYRRARRRPEEVSLEHDPGDLVLDPPAPEIGDVIRGLACLPFNQRAALVMREFEGRPLREIASELGVSTPAVEALLFRARRALREQLEGGLTCDQAEQAISRQLDGALPRADRGPLRAHLRQCRECASLARRMRAQRGGLRSLGAVIPLPASVGVSRVAAPASLASSASAPVTSATGSSLLSSVSGSILAKVAVATVAGAAAVGGGYAVMSVHPTGATAPRTARAVERKATRDAHTGRVDAGATRSRSKAVFPAGAGWSGHRGRAQRGSGVPRGRSAITQSKVPVARGHVGRGALKTRGNPHRGLGPPPWARSHGTSKHHGNGHGKPSWAGHPHSPHHSHTRPLRRPPGRAMRH